MDKILKTKGRKKSLAMAAAAVLTVFLMLPVLGACRTQPEPELEYDFRSVTRTSYSQVYTSPNDIVFSDTHAFVSDFTSKKVYKISLSTNLVEKEREFAEQVNGVFLDGTGLYVMTGALAGVINKLDTELNPLATAEAGHTPVRMVAAGDYLYAANRFSNTVTVYSKSNLTLTKTINVGREPTAMVVAGTTIFVAGHLSSDAATDSVVSSDLYMIDTATNALATANDGYIKLPNGTSNVKDAAVSKDGKYVYISCLFARYGAIFSQLDRGWVVTNGLVVVDVTAKAVLCGVLIDDPAMGAANPWGIGVTDNGLIVMAASGSDAAIVINAEEMHKRIDNVKNGTGLVDNVARIADRLDFLSQNQKHAVSIKERVDIGEKGLRAVAVKDNVPFVASYFGGKIIKLDITKNQNGSTETNFTSFNIGEQSSMNNVREGEILFHDATLTYQQWLSCTSCHPDARADGFSWDTLGDGAGNPKNTRSLMYSHRTSPVLTSGVKSAEQNVRDSLIHDFENFGITEQQVQATNEYLRSLKPEQSPYLNRDGTLTESAARGKSLFDDMNCASCHSGPNYTDYKTHPTPSSTELDPSFEKDLGREINTMRLVELWRTAPYLYFGGVTDVRAVVRSEAAKLNRTLTDAEVNDLANYILSLGDDGDYFGVEQVHLRTALRDEVYNKLLPNSTIYKIDVRKQYKYNGDALMKFELIDPDGNITKTEYAKFQANVPVGSLLSVRLNIRTPASFGNRTYSYKITITDLNNNQMMLAKEYVIKS